MRRFQIAAVTSALAALALAAAGEAATGQQVFAGEIEDQPDATVRMKTGATNELRVKVFTARDFSVDCDGADGSVRRATLKGTISVGNEGRFHARDDNGKTVLNVRGEIDGRKAEGVFRFSGKLDVESGGARECDSGRLHWTAHASAS